ncbi:30S ribosomal protein S16 [compost metagenome]
MVKIRLKRIGATKKPKYRMVVADGRSRRDGRVIEEIGFYDPQKEPAEVRINEEAALKWLRTGAQPSDTARELLKKIGAFEKLSNPTA